MRHRGSSVSAAATATDTAASGAAGNAGTGGTSKRKHSDDDEEDNNGDEQQQQHPVKRGRETAIDYDATPPPAAPKVTKDTAAAAGTSVSVSVRRDTEVTITAEVATVDEVKRAAAVQSILTT